jgi:uncharacterized protein (DUF4415 family)
MKPTSTTRTPAIPDDDAPPFTQTDFDRARFRVGEKEVSRAEWQASLAGKLGKRRVNIMLDVPIIEHFKAIAGERGYQTLINATLREAMRGQQIEETLRRVIREELHTA